MKNKEIIEYYNNVVKYLLNNLEKKLFEQKQLIMKKLKKIILIKTYDKNNIQNINMTYQII